jgi:murein DD-endopeptidase MepM/ murein hydrolase activator NlpD
VNAVNRSHLAAIQRLTGLEDSPPLTLASSDGDMPHGRELSLAWLSGAVMTGLTSVMLMGAVLFVSFQGRDTFSTPYQALSVARQGAFTPDLTSSAKTARARPLARTQSSEEIIEASIREVVDGVARIRRQPFSRIRATLATSATALSDDIPAFDPNELLSRNQPIAAVNDTLNANPDIYGAEVEGEVTVEVSALPMQFTPAAFITDRVAGAFVRSTLESAYSVVSPGGLAYAGQPGVNVLGIESGAGATLSGVAENVTQVAKTQRAPGEFSGRTERVVAMRTDTNLADALAKNGFTDPMIDAISATLRNVYPSDNLAAGSRLRILLGPSRSSQSLIPYRLSIYTPQEAHAATVALTDGGRYVIGTAPPPIEFTDDDTEEVEVGNLPSIYRSIFETARKRDIDDATIERIISMFAFDLDLTKPVTAGDTIEILQTATDKDGVQELLYVGLEVGGNSRSMYRYRTDDGVVDFYDENGQTGKKFLIRRPLEGGGRLTSRFGYRIHPIFKTRKLHTGVDLAAPFGTPVYAGGDGVIQRASRVTGIGVSIILNHANGFQTIYAHMSRIAKGIKRGTRVRQGQIIGYVGSTGYSTGNHLHYEVKINGRRVDPLGVRLPRDKSLPNQYAGDFDRTITQVRDLMERDTAPIVVASN